MSMYPHTEDDYDKLRNRYMHHAPKEDQLERYAMVRGKCLELAHLILQATPPSREQSAALAKLDEVMFNANAAIARNE